MASDDERQPLLLQSISGHMTVVRPSTQRKIACAAVLVAEMFERVACFGLSGTLVLFLTKEPLCWWIWLAPSVEILFNAVMYATGLFGGWLSDSYLGRYPTIIIGYSVYIIGYLYLPLLTYYTQYAYPPNCTISYKEGTPCNSTWHPDMQPPFCNTSYDGKHSTCSITICISIVLIAIGAGIVRTNLAPFGGDQVSF